MRAGWIAVAVLGGCGFQVSIATDAAGSDTPVIDADPTVDADPDALVDAMTIDGPFTVDLCPTSYITIQSQPSRYRLITAADDVLAQHNLCTLDGAHLAVLDTVSEANDLRGFIDNTNNLSSQFVYVGSVQRENQGSPSAGWISATGAFNSAFWESGEPNDGLGVENEEEQLAVIWRGNDVLADIDNRSLPALCECDGLEITNDYKIVLLEAVD